MIRIQCLGPVAVGDGTAAASPELLWRKHLALLIYLACSPRRTRTRDHLVGLLWHDRPENAARHSLNEALRIIRRSAGADAVRTTVDQVTLAAEAVELDTEDVERLLARGDVRSAADQVRGEFMEGFSVPNAPELEHWLGAERRAWRSRGVDCLVAAVSGFRQDADLAGALAAARRAVRLDPTSETAVRALMEVETLNGDRAAALATFERYTSDLATQLDAEPSRDLAQLADRLRQAGPARPAAAAARSAVQRRAPLVGRAEAVHHLERVWDRGRAGTASAVVIAGDSGLGKTRLLDDFRARVMIDGGTTVTVRLVEADRLEPGAAIRGLARDRLAETPGVNGARPGSLATFAQFVTTWADRYPASRNLEPAPLAQAFVDVIGAATEHAPIVLAVDDAQWLDQDSADILQRVLRDLPDRSVMILWATTPFPASAGLDQIRRQLGHDIPGAAILLEPLDQSELGILAHWAFPTYGNEALARITRRLWADTAGYPLLAIDLLDAIAGGLALRDDTAPWPQPLATLSQTRPGDLPDTITAATRVAYRRLSPDAQLVLSAAAVGPQRVDPVALSTMLDLTADRLDSALDELEWHRWLASDARGYTFVARIIRDIVDRDFVTGSQRRRWGTGLTPA